MTRWILRMGLLVLACGPDTPSNPTWEKDVKPIVAANCVRCHGENASGGAPAGFRLDRFDTTTRVDGLTQRGAYRMAAYMAERAGQRRDMPPNGPELSDRKREILMRWAANGAPRGDGNQAATITLRNATPLRADESLTLSYDIHDPDGDSVAGEFLFGSGTNMATIPSSLHSGRGEVTWDTGVVPAGTYTLFARMSEGKERTSLDLKDETAEKEGTLAVVDLGAVEIAHANHNVAPSVTVSLAGIKPVILVDSKAPAEIVVSVSDPDSADPLTSKVVAFHGTTEIVIAEAVTGANPMPLRWDTRAVPEATNWRIRAETTDGKTTRTFLTDYFVVSHRTTRNTFESSIEGLLTKSCGSCHNPPARIYLPLGPGEIDPWTTKIWQRVIQRRDMPPPSARQGLFESSFEPLTEAERSRIGEWILAGSPP